MVYKLPSDTGAAHPRPSPSDGSMAVNQQSVRDELAVAARGFFPSLFAVRSPRTCALWLLLSAAALVAPLPRATHAQDLTFTFGAPPTVSTSWEEVERGFFIRRYEFPNQTTVLRAEVILAKFEPNYFSFHVATAAKGARTWVSQLTDQLDGVAGINASFFDEGGKPLGLVVVDEVVRQRVQLGGNLLTGVFFTDGEHPGIVHRSSVSSVATTNAVQAGPRLIVDGQPLELAAPLAASRRSGIAVTANGEVLLYSTVLRFPGTTLHQIQQMLLDPALGVTVTNALNLDGGGSSQLYLKLPAREPISISGGDTVPVGIVVKRRRTAQQG